MVGSHFAEAIVSTILTLGSVPQPRVGPSVTTLGDKVYIFGGMMESKFFNDLYSFYLNTNAWELVTPSSCSPVPDPRYFHSATVYKDRYLIISGGQGEQIGDTNNVLNDICLFNLQTLEWQIFKFSETQFPPRYAHLTKVLGDELFIIGGQDASNIYTNDVYSFNLESFDLKLISKIEAKLGLYCSAMCTNPTTPEKIFGYANTKSSNPNYDFLTIDKEGKAEITPFSKVDKELPPYFRFPETSIIQDHMVVSGYVQINKQIIYCIWHLNFNDNTWSKIDTGPCLSLGSWNRGFLHPKENKYIIFGHREREIYTDYQSRRVNFNHISVVHLESNNIFRQPKVNRNSNAIDLGQMILYSPRFSNFAFITLDNYRIQVNLGIIRSRWPNFDSFHGNSQDRDSSTVSVLSPTFQFQDNYSVVQAFVLYLYTNSIDFKQVNDLQLLLKLLIFSSKYAVTNLYDLVAGQIHKQLDIKIAPEVYRAAMTAKREGLMLRSLSIMIQKKQELLNDVNFWGPEYPANIRQTILNYMPPTYKSPILEPLTPIPSPSYPSLSTKTSATKVQLTHSVSATSLNKLNKDMGASPRHSMSASSPQSPTASIYGTNKSSNDDDRSTIMQEDPDTASIISKPSSNPRKKSSLFGKFGSTIKPSAIANIFSFSSSGSSTFIAPTTSTTTSSNTSTISSLPNSPVYSNRTLRKGSMQKDNRDPNDKFLQAVHDIGFS